MPKILRITKKKKKKKNSNSFLFEACEMWKEKRTKYFLRHAKYAKTVGFFSSEGKNFSSGERTFGIVNRFCLSFQPFLIKKASKIVTMSLIAA